MCIALFDSISHIKISVRANKKCICIASAQNHDITKANNTHLLIKACQKIPSKPWHSRDILFATKMLSPPGQGISIFFPSPHSSTISDWGYTGQVQHSTGLAPSRHRAAQPKASLRQKPSLPRDGAASFETRMKFTNKGDKDFEVFVVFFFLGGEVQPSQKNDRF